MIRARANDWRVQTIDENGRWVDHHVGSRAGPAIRAYVELSTEHRRLLKNGKPLRMSEDPSLFEEGA